MEKVKGDRNKVGTIISHELLAIYTLKKQSSMLGSKRLKWDELKSAS
uniref:Uncharacterized protein n=1 Tax=Arundo donax TaxID=35708 RepID=A0A0A8YGX8_ARUDO